MRVLVIEDEIKLARNIARVLDEEYSKLLLIDETFACDNLCTGDK